MFRQFYEEEFPEVVRDSWMSRQRLEFYRLRILNVSGIRRGLDPGSKISTSFSLNPSKVIQAVIENLY